MTAKQQTDLPVPARGSDIGHGANRINEHPLSDERAEYRYASGNAVGGASAEGIGDDAANERADREAKPHRSRVPAKCDRALPRLRDIAEIGGPDLEAGDRRDALEDTSEDDQRQPGRHGQRNRRPGEGE